MKMREEDELTGVLFRGTAPSDSHPALRAREKIQHSRSRASAVDQRARRRDAIAKEPLAKKYGPIDRANTLDFRGRESPPLEPNHVNPGEVRTVPLGKAEWRDILDDH